MMKFMPMPHKISAAASDSAKSAAVDQFTDILQPPAKEGIRCAANQQPLLPRKGDQLTAFIISHCQRLFRIDMLARLQCRKIICKMCLRCGQVQHQIDFRVSNQLIAGGICFRNTMLCSLALRFLQPAGCTGRYLNGIIFFQVIQVNVTDVTNTNHANTDLFHLLFSFLVKYSNRAAA